MNEHASLGIQAGSSGAEVTPGCPATPCRSCIGFGGRRRHRRRAARLKWLGVRSCGAIPITSTGGPCIGARPRRTQALVHDRRRGATGRQLCRARRTRSRRLIDIFFVIAATLQVALWARELILGVIEHRAGGPRKAAASAARSAIIRLLVTIAMFAIAIVVMLDNLGVNVTGAGRRARHRRHRHRPRRAGHFRRPVRGALDPVRQAVPPRRFDPLGHDHRHGRADRAQVDAGARRSPARRW